MSLKSTVTSFRANYDYLPSTNDEIELNKGDICYVQQPYGDPKGWLLGMNSRSNEHGRFPGTYCEILNENATVPLPPRPAKATKLERPKFYPINGHMVEKVSFTKPVWCEHCHSYIWGGNRISLKCSYCNICCHIGCVYLYNDIGCNEYSNTLEYPENEIFKPIIEWSNIDVLEWMVAVHFHPYLKLIRDSQIEGKDLPNIDERFLKSFGISIDLHARLFQVALDELLSPPADGAAVRSAEVAILDNDNVSTHQKLYEHTFTTFQCCNICQKPMFGIFRQGLMCLVCGIQCHPSCLYRGLPECSGSYTYARRLSDAEDPSFCCNFISPAIPPVMLQCIERVETSGLFTPDIYDGNYSYGSCQTLRGALNQDPNEVNMNDEYWADPLCAAYVLKSFLMELPDPLLDKEMYDDFIQLSQTSNRTDNEVIKLLESQQKHNYFQLLNLISHLVKIGHHSTKNNMTFDRLADIFSVMLVRPPDGQARKFIENLTAQKDVLLMIFKVAASLQDLNSGMDFSSLSFNDESVETEPWLWEEASNSEAQQRLQGKPDGSYLVRGSERRKGQWTLAVKEGGKDRLISILQENGLYGFNKENMRFESLKELIEYHQVHPINNKKLTIHLIFPCGKSYVESDNECEKLKARYDEVDQKLKQLKLLEYEMEDKLKLLEQCKVLSEAQTDIVKFLEDQYSVAKQSYDEASNADKEGIEESIDSLNEVLLQEKQMWTELDDQLLALTHECNILNAKLNELSPELPILEEEYNKLHNQMRRLDEKKAKASEIEDWKGIYDDPSALRNEKRVDMQTQYNTTERVGELSEEDWLFGFLEKSEINSMLYNKPNGTFLVRKSRKHPYAISLVYDNAVKHVPILQGPNGFGFAEPHNIYKTLHDLINHYHNQSLRMHNKILDTTLQIPYRFFETKESEPLYI